MLTRTPSFWCYAAALLSRAARPSPEGADSGGPAHPGQNSTLRDVASRGTETLRSARKVINLATLGRHLGAKAGITEGTLGFGVRTRGAEVARFLEVTTSAVNRLAVCEALPELRKYPRAL